jgi:hypothetical protein
MFRMVVFLAIAVTLTVVAIEADADSRLNAGNRAATPGVRPQLLIALAPLQIV